ncbi:metal transporter [Amycolatopsis orientalis]|uniref:metal transporter n=1 Tax=Amycolatopsis orientalis TaxID=31958 RepID=UPI000410DE04|nr:metal transporter [Amycolatopsis orientalis]
MTSAERPAGIMVNVGLGIVFAAGIVFTAVMLMNSWGGTSWVFGSTVAVVLSGLALLRERQKTLIAGAGVAVAALAVVVSLIAGDSLPKEPSPITGLALAVLVGSAIRTLPSGAAMAIAAGGIAVTVGAWVDGRTTVPYLATAVMVIALVVGPSLRARDHHLRVTGAPPRSYWSDSPQR